MSHKGTGEGYGQAIYNYEKDEKSHNTFLR
jgi:hypothetical protein